ncbi:MAG: metal ABC transporter permease [Planctomycetota bacterium]|nr:metal ABC transporter permease [Planctomycetota bacterium]
MSSLDPALDLFPLAASILAAITCGILGNFLLLRRESLMGDAISHGVLPGLVIGFLLTGDRSPVVMMFGATAAGVVTILLVSLIRRYGRVEPGAAMGVVFSVLFALGVLLIEQAAARQVDLDADCVLYGQLETLAWFDAPTSWAGTLSWSTIQATPRPVWTLAHAGLLARVFTIILFKELRLAVFDPGLAAALGFRPRLLGLATNVLVAVATVASFEAVGSILVIAMLICPAATARLLTDRLSSQIAWSVGVALLSTVIGYRAATIVPGWFDGDSVNAAGAMAVCSGGSLALVMLAAPRHGVLAGLVRRRKLERRVAIDDLITALWRNEEDAAESATPGNRTHARPRGFKAPRIVGAARRLGLVTGGLPEPRLTEQGRARATELMIRHRLWESYLVSEAGLAPDHVHDAAEQLEHVRLAPPRSGDRDPQGRPIPPKP